MHPSSLHYVYYEQKEIDEWHGGSSFAIEKNGIEGTNWVSKRSMQRQFEFEGELSPSQGE